MKGAKIGVSVQILTSRPCVVAGRLGRIADSEGRASASIKDDRGFREVSSAIDCRSRTAKRPRSMASHYRAIDMDLSEKGPCLPNPWKHIDRKLSHNHINCRSAAISAAFATQRFASINCHAAANHCQTRMARRTQRFGFLKETPFVFWGKARREPIQLTFAITASTLAHAPASRQKRG